MHAGKLENFLMRIVCTRKMETKFETKGRRICEDGCELEDEMRAGQLLLSFGELSARNGKNKNREVLKLKYMYERNVGKIVFNAA
jgi:hypothetical protein